MVLMNLSHEKKADENCVIDASEGFWDLYELNGFIVDEQFSRI